MFTPRYFRPRFILFVGCVIIPSILLLRVIVLFFQGLDHVFFPGFRYQEVKKPLFILSNPRSGTTFLHRLLEKDDQFTYLTLWQSLFNSITLYKLVEFTGNVDQRIGRPITRLLDAIDRSSFKGWDGIHKTGLRYSEEDEFLFVNLFLTPGLILFFPYLREVADIYSIDDLPDKARKKVVKNIRRAVQRHVYATRGKTFLAKNATAGGRLGIYREAFPDMRAIYIRSPLLKSVASSLSVFTKPWSFHSPACYRRKYESLSVVEMVHSNYLGIMRQRKKFADDDVIDIEYDNLVSDSEATVKSIYQHFGLSMSTEYRYRLGQGCTLAKSYKSTHVYSIEDYGFTHQEIAHYFSGLPTEDKAHPGTEEYQYQAD